MSEMSPGIEAPDKTLYIFQKKLTEQYNTMVSRPIYARLRKP